MAYNDFLSSSQQDNAIDRFEKPIKKIILDAAKAALDAEGIEYKVDRQGTIRITKQYLKNERWTSYFSIDSWAAAV